MLKVLLVVIVIAIVVFACVMLVDRQLNGLQRPGSWRPPRAGRGPRRTPPQRPLAPDDDPDFLWQLNRRNRHRPPKDET